METSLYIHIPFCSKKCDYCDFYSVPLLENSCVVPDEKYVDAVLNEVKFYVNYYGITRWNTIYTGGGTPSQLKPELLFKLISGVIKAVKNQSCSEITVEMNPDDVTEELLLAAESSGVTRISLGIQALDDKPLNLIHRRCTKDQVIKTLNLINEKWHGRLSVDFMAGLPGHTYKSFENQFELINNFHIDHISLYTLTLEENTPLYRNIKSGKLKYSSDKADRMWILGRNILEKKGFRQYEVSNFSIPGYESAHNTVYWNLENYIGAGCGASGSVYNLRSGIRWTNTKDIKKYEEFWKNWENSFESVYKFRQNEVLSKEDQEFEFIMMGFRKLNGISKQAYEERFSLNLDERLGIKNGLFKDWTDRGLTKVIKEKNDIRYSLNRRGILMLNLFLESLV